MFQYFLDWINVTTVTVSGDIQFVFSCIASYFILSFLLDFFRFLMYYVGERRK